MCFKEHHDDAVLFPWCASARPERTVDASMSVSGITMSVSSDGAQDGREIHRCADRRRLR